MTRKQKKLTMEEELEAFSSGKEAGPDDVARRILQVIKKHASEVSQTKMQYLNDLNGEMYSIYGNIEAAYILLTDDLKKEGLWV